MTKTRSTKKRRVLDHLARGNDITAKQAFSRFGVKNMRALMSDIRSQVEAYGNWEVSSRSLDNGATCYSMDFNGYTDNPFYIRVNG